MTKKVTSKTVSDGTDRKAGRKADGKFAKGNRYGRGRPDMHRLAEYRQTINTAVTPAELKKVIAVLLRKAKQGDLMAVRELLDRTVGKATQAPQTADGLDFEMPQLATTKDTVKASNAILQGLSQGRLTPEDAYRLSQIVELARRTLETQDLAEQVERLSKELGV